MPSIVSFISRQNRSTTLLTSRVVSCLNERGYSTAVVKSTENNTIFSGLSGVSTISPQQEGFYDMPTLGQNQTKIRLKEGTQKLTPIAHRFFRDVDIVIGQGFEHDHRIAKIEVSGDGRDLVDNRAKRVIAMVSDQQVSGNLAFHSDDTQHIADFIEKRFLSKESREQTVLFVNNRKVALNGFIQKILAKTVIGFIGTLKKIEGSENIELYIRRPKDDEVNKKWTFS